MKLKKKVQMISIQGSSFDEKKKKSHFRWFVCVQRRVINPLEMKSELIQVELGNKNRERKTQSNINISNKKLTYQLRK